MWVNEGRKIEEEKQKVKPRQNKMIYKKYRLEGKNIKTKYTDGIE